MKRLKSSLLSTLIILIAAIFSTSFSLANNTADNEITNPTLLSEESGLYDVRTGRIYQGDTYRHRFYDVTGCTHLLVSGASATNAEAYPLAAAFDAYGAIRGVYGFEPVTTYQEYEIDLPSSATTLMIQSSMASQKIECREDSVTDALENSGSLPMMKNLADMIVMESKKNPFVFETFDNGYVTFVADDLMEDLDGIAAVFEEYGYPLCIAAIPDKVKDRATYLKEIKGSFIPNMQMSDIMHHVVENGGEILMHNSEVITEDNQNDDAVMKTYFVTGKQSLERIGFHIRGLIKAGGEGSITGTPQIERWLVLGGYEYSNMGTAQNYSTQRITIQKPQDEIINDISSAYNEKKWISFMIHSYEFGEGKTFTGEQDLREILDYCKKLNIPVVTYSYIFDHFSSSETRAH